MTFVQGERVCEALMHRHVFRFYDSVNKYGSSFVMEPMRRFPETPLIPPLTLR